MQIAMREDSADKAELVSGTVGWEFGIMVGWGTVGW